MTAPSFETRPPRAEEPVVFRTPAPVGQDAQRRGSGSRRPLEGLFDRYTPPLLPAASGSSVTPAPPMRAVARLSYTISYVPVDAENTPPESADEVRIEARQMLGSPAQRVRRRPHDLRWVGSISELYTGSEHDRRAFERGLLRRALNQAIEEQGHYGPMGLRQAGRAWAGYAYRQGLAEGSGRSRTPPLSLTPVDAAHLDFVQSYRHEASEPTQFWSSGRDSEDTETDESW